VSVEVPAGQPPMLTKNRMGAKKKNAKTIMMPSAIDTACLTLCTSNMGERRVSFAVLFQYDEAL
jgi:hypothetical protein